jgi:hypothetical protein
MVEIARAIDASESGVGRAIKREAIERRSRRP